MASKKAKPTPGKKSASKKVSKKAGAKKSGLSNFRELAIEAAAEVIDCGGCVIRTIESHCGRRVGSLDDRLRDVCAPCDIGAMADLGDALIESCNASPNLTLTCSLSVRQVIQLVCGGNDNA